MSNYNETNDWVEEVENKDNGVWDNVVREGDDEETIRLKKKLAKAEAELELEKAKAESSYEGNFVSYGNRFGRNISYGKVRKRNQSWAEAVGYDKKAKEKARKEGNLIDKYVKDKEKQMLIYVLVIVIALVFIGAKFVLSF